MSNATFLGGFKVLDGKKLTKNKPITSLKPLGELVFPLSQYNGGVANALVSKGDAVLVGQIIGESSDDYKTNIISSVSGKVKAIETRLSPTGGKIESIVIENDDKYETIENYGIKEDYKGLTKERIIEKIRNAGIIGLGGAGFPSHIKLQYEKANEIKYIIINALESDMFVTSDSSSTESYSDKVIEGAKILLHLFENAKVIIAIGTNMPNAIKLIEEKLIEEDRVEIKTLRPNYPIGEERQMIYAVTKRKLPLSTLPIKAGYIVNNVSTIIAIFDAVALGIPLIERVVTVTGDAIKEPANFRVRIGTSHAEIIEAAGGFVTEPKKVISGGLMSGKALYSLELPVTGLTNAIVAFVSDEDSYSAMPCIRCGKCIEVCPSKIMPVELAMLAEREDSKAFIKLNGLECIECGYCTFICPSKRKLLQSIKYGKVICKNKNKK
ncbi:MAG TPA: electron transport complex subunit RsxC [Clostridiales bacterium]|nr:electron transport complex subunit RsxC [Clostridiales bacterium]